MSDPTELAEWFYVGHYGQLGPLTLGQMKELAGDGVITQETYVWRQGMSDWSTAGSVPDIRAELGIGQAFVIPPATPVSPPPAPARTRELSPVPPQVQTSYGIESQAGWQYIQSHAPKSDKSRIAAGILNILVPGVGRLYLGYAAHGVLQIFVTVITCGIGILWPLIDGIYILAGGLRLDGYGRRLED